MKIATWNVNSLNVRLPHVLDWLDEHRPDGLAPGKDPACRPVCGAYKTCGAHEACSADKEAPR